MPDPSITPLPARADVLASVCAQAGLQDPPLRVVAEDLLGDGAAIDLVAVDDRGAVVLVMLAEPGQDAAGFTCSLAQCEWVRARVKDWIRLAPGLELRPDAEVRALLLCAGFSTTTISAASSPAGRGVGLVAVRAIRNGSDLAILLDPLPLAASSPAPEASAPAPAAAFRSGLSEQELGLSPEEIRDFEP